MATIYNSDLSKEMTIAGALQTSREKIPNQLAEKVVPVMEVNPKLLRRANICASTSASGAGAATIYTVPAGKEFYLTGINASMIKDAANDHATGNYQLVSTTVGGIATALIRVPIITLTAQNFILSQTFTPPLKIDTSINLNVATVGAGNFIRCASIQGYTIDNINA